MMIEEKDVPDRYKELVREWRDDGVSEAVIKMRLPVLRMEDRFRTDFEDSVWKGLSKLVKDK